MRLPFLYHVRRFKLLLLLTVLTPMFLSATAAPAEANLQICNRTENRVGVAIGYKDDQGWATEGWWNLPNGDCKVLLHGPLVARFYYVYALDYDTGEEWSGPAFMCTQEKEFTIRGINDCPDRGFDRTGFFEVDTGAEENWTIHLVETEQTGSGAS